MSKELKKVCYAGPHPEITLHNVPEAGDILVLKRGEAVELPREVAEDLIKRKKVKDTPRDTPDKKEKAPVATADPK